MAGAVGLGLAADHAAAAGPSQMRVDCGTAYQLLGLCAVFADLIFARFEIARAD